MCFAYNLWWCSERTRQHVLQSTSPSHSARCSPGNINVALCYQQVRPLSPAEPASRWRRRCSELTLKEIGGASAMVILLLQSLAIFLLLPSQSFFSLDVRQQAQRSVSRPFPQPWTKRKSLRQQARKARSLSLSAHHHLHIFSRPYLSQS